MTPKDLSIDDITIGDFAFFEVDIREEDIINFAKISGDYNPLHLDENYASKTQFGHRIVHGMYLGSLVSRLVGMELPGKRALLIKESLEFKKPVFIGDKLIIRGTIITKSQTTGLIELAIDIKQGTEILVTGSVYARILNL